MELAHMAVTDCARLWSANSAIRHRFSLDMWRQGEANQYEGQVHIWHSRLKRSNIAGRKVVMEYDNRVKRVFRPEVAVQSCERCGHYLHARALSEIVDDRLLPMPPALAYPAGGQQRVAHFLL